MKIRINKIKVEQTHPLRIEILRNRKANNYQFEADKELSTFHLGAFDKDECVGIVSYMKKEYQGQENTIAYQLRGMAVALAYQNRGIGAALIEASYPILREKKASLVWCNAREIALDFYKKNGFEIAGAVFEIPSIGKHFVMARSIDY
jgi:GNAT superfamily N-acetyltransferase